MQNNSAKPLLFEIGTEELPTKAVKLLSTALGELITKELHDFNLKFENIKIFATPRRIGFLISNLQTKQQDYFTEKRGPAIKAAYDQNNNFTPAALGFASSCGTTPEKLSILESDKGSWLIYKTKISGSKTEQLLQEIITNAVNKLPIAKPMRWANYEHSFVRPVHWLVLLYGEKTVKINLFGLKANNLTYGHRFLAPKAIALKNPLDYEKKLQKAYVLADFNNRLDNIKQQVTKTANKLKLNALINQDLLEEVTSLVEWPVALLGKFNSKFTNVPQECLITSMVANQKYFAVTNNKNKIQPYFIFISNIVSKNNKQVISGNERVLNARLSDAEFFYNNDKKQLLKNKVNLLANITYQQKLGTLLDKTKRNQALSLAIAKILTASNNNHNKAQINTNILTTAANLAKADLCTEMVYEFPELQGIMGKYYALANGEDSLTASILEQHYLPKFSGDKLPESIEACCLAIADRLDTLVGIFAIDQKPTGEKDPFGLRRAALGVLRILIEKKLNLDLKILINLALNNFIDLLKLDKNKQEGLTKDCLDFCFERLKKYYTDQNITINLFYAVNNSATSSPYDFNQRIVAVNNFLKLPQAANLIAANKRVKNILNKQDINTLPKDININLLKEPAEINLNKLLINKNNELSDLFINQQYNNILQKLADLQNPIDNFFDSVMVNAEDSNLKNNRLLLLKNVQNLFNKVADIAELQ